MSALDLGSEAAVPGWAADYIGIPFAHRGRTREGCDCWGLLALIYAERSPMGSLPPYEGHHWYKGQNPAVISPDTATYAAGFEEVPIDAARLWDGLLIRMRGYPIHVGLVLNDEFMIHTTDEDGVCIERYRSALWAKRVIACYRRKG